MHVKTWKNKFQTPILLAGRCNHLIKFCNSCLESSIRFMVEEFGAGACDQINCLDVDCDRYLDLDEIQEYADDKTFALYSRHKASQHPNFRMCLGPGCQSWRIYDDLRDPRIQCTDCNFEMCATHLHAWHRGLTCAEYDQKTATLDAWNEARFAEQNLKRCPRCRALVEKDDGCFHVQCTGCFHQFCWECLADWSEIMPYPDRPGYYVRTAHAEGCWFRRHKDQPIDFSGKTVPNNVPELDDAALEEANLLDLVT